MARHIYRETVTILIGGTDAALESRAGLKALALCSSMTIYSPSTLAEVVTVQISPNEDPAGSGYGYRSLQRWTATGAADVTLSAGKAILLPGIACAALNLHADGAVAAAREFIIEFSAEVFDRGF